MGWWHPWRYIGALAATVERPAKELKAFAKVRLEAGRATTVRLALDPRSLAYFDEAARAWVAEAGEFEVLVGESSAELPLAGRFRLTEGWREPVGSPPPSGAPQHEREDAR